MAVDWHPAAEYEDIRYELSGDGIAKITINRPEVRNAFRPQTVVELSDAFTRARRVRRATPRELRTLEHLLLAGLRTESGFAQAIAEYQASRPEIRVRRLSGSRRSGPRAAAGAAARTAW